MGKTLYKKPEPSDIQGMCVICEIRPQKKRSNGAYQALCRRCDNERFNIKNDSREYSKYKKPTCEKCGFVPENPCQLDVDHIDNNHRNNDPSNFQTLCANCHRLKTYHASFKTWRKTSHKYIGPQ